MHFYACGALGVLARLGSRMYTCLDVLADVSGRMYAFFCVCRLLLGSRVCVGPVYAGLRVDSF